MPREYTQKKKEYLQRGMTQEQAKRQAAIWFYRQFGISVKKAHDLANQGKWMDYKKRHHLAANGVRPMLSLKETKELKWKFFDVHGYYPDERDRAFRDFVLRKTGTQPYKFGLRERMYRTFPYLASAGTPIVHLLLYGDRDSINRIEKQTGIKIVDWEPFDGQVGAEFIVSSKEEKQKIIDLAKQIGVGVAEEGFSVVVRPKKDVGVNKGKDEYKSSRGGGWKGESQRHMMSRRGVKSKRR